MNRPNGIFLDRTEFTECIDIKFCNLFFFFRLTTTKWLNIVDFCIEIRSHVLFYLPLHWLVINSFRIVYILVELLSCIVSVDIALNIVCTVHFAAIECLIKNYLCSWNALLNLMIRLRNFVVINRYIVLSEFDVLNNMVETRR